MILDKWVIEVVSAGDVIARWVMTNIGEELNLTATTVI
jgi:hypothetical protein